MKNLKRVTTIALAGSLLFTSVPGIALANVEADDEVIVAQQLPYYDTFDDYRNLWIDNINYIASVPGNVAYASYIKSIIPELRGVVYDSSLSDLMNEARIDSIIYGLTNYDIDWCGYFPRYERYYRMYGDSYAPYAYQKYYNYYWKNSSYRNRYSNYWDYDWDGYNWRYYRNRNRDRDYYYYSSDSSKTETTAVYRLYNATSGEHVFTTESSVRDTLVGQGWTNEGTGWKAPKSGTAVYQLYNASANKYLYTKDTNERDALVNSGWNNDGVAFYSSSSTSKPIYRLFNAKNGKHFFTAAASERDALVNAGWVNEGIGFYGA